MSQEGVIDVINSNPSILTTVIANSGSAMPIANTLNILGALVAAGTNPVRTVASGNTVTTQVQISQAIASTNINNVGLSAFNSANFSVDANGFVSLSGGTSISKIIPNSGTSPVVPDATGAVSILGTGSITAVGSLNTETIQLTGLTNHAVLVGAGTTTITKVGPTATVGQVLQSAGVSADPAFSTATYPLTTTINQILYSSADNTVTGLATANDGVLITSNTGVPSFLPNGVTGQVLSATTGSPPSWITNAATDYHVARYIVSAGGSADGANYTTIASAISAAVSAGGNQTVFIQPGTYTENFTITPNINLTAFSCDATTPNVIIIGKITMTAAGTSSISGINLQTNSDFVVSITGSVASSVFLKSCKISATNNTALNIESTATGSVITLNNCTGDISTTGICYFTIAAGRMDINYSLLTNSGGSTTQSSLTNSSGSNIRYCTFNNAILYNTSNSSTLNYTQIQMGGLAVIPLTLTSTGSLVTRSSRVESGSQSSISVGANTLLQCQNLSLDTSNTNAITGSATGVIKYSNISFTSSSSTINAVLTFTPLDTWLVPNSATTDGVAYYDGKRIVTTLAGTTGQVLTSNGAGVAPTYQDNASKFILISSQSASSSATISFTGLTTYNNYLLVWRSIWAATSTAILELLVSTNNGSTYQTTGYAGGINYNSVSSTAITNNNSTAYFPLSGSNNSGVNNSGNLFINDINTGDTVCINGQVSYLDSTSGLRSMGVISGRSGQTAVNAIRLQMSSGNIASGTFTLYGIKET